MGDIMTVAQEVGSGKKKKKEDERFISIVVVVVVVARVVVVVVVVVVARVRSTIQSIAIFFKACAEACDVARAEHWMLN